MMTNPDNNVMPGDASPQIDLSQLAVERNAPGGSAPRSVAKGRHWFTRYVLPLAILVGFAGLFGWAARDSFLPAQPVTVTPVIVTRAAVQREGTPLCQAAGWIEPRPTPVVVSALAEGVVRELLVVEGQSVERGQLLARLIDTDANLLVQQAEADLKLREADVTDAEAARIAARTALDYPSGLRAALADAEARLAEIELALGNLPHRIETAEARLRFAADSALRKARAGQAIAGQVLQEARTEQAAAESMLSELRSQRPTLQEQRQALWRKRTALEEQLRLLTAEKRAVAGAEAALAAAYARREQACVALEAARLNLDRMAIRAPITGRVLSLEARPGTRLAGMDAASGQGASTVVTLYDPQSLQVRVDVRLEDVPHVQIGQPAEIETAALPEPITGIVLWTTTRADIQKNTLQVKVAIDDPPSVITPEMLAQVKFLAPPSVASDGAEHEPLRLMIPRQLVAGGDGGGAAVWLADLDRGVARRQTVQLGGAAGELVEVTAGLRPTDKLIVAGREALSDGSRIRVTGEDSALGISAGYAAGSVAGHPRIARSPADSP